MGMANGGTSIYWHVTNLKMILLLAIPPPKRNKPIIYDIWCLVVSRQVDSSSCYLGWPWSSFSQVTMLVSKGQDPNHDYNNYYWSSSLERYFLIPTWQFSTSKRMQSLRHETNVYILHIPFFSTSIIRQLCPPTYRKSSRLSYTHFN